MAVDVTLNQITSGYNISKINENFQRIDTALQDAVSRSGTAPNQMVADLDLNSYDLLNVGVLDADSIQVNGVPIGQFTSTFKGLWVSATTYVVNDVVRDASGNLWIAKGTSTNSSPVEGANWTLFMPGSSVADGTVTFVKTDGSYARVTFDTVPALLSGVIAGKTLSYTTGASNIVVTAGQIINAEGFRYSVAASGTAVYDKTTTPLGYHLITSGGVKLFVLPSDNGQYNANSFGIIADGTTDETAKLRMLIEFAGGAGITLGRSGRIRVTSSIERLGDIIGTNPNGTVIFADTGTYSTSAVVKATGSAVQVQNLTVNVSRGGDTLTGTAAWGFASGDIGFIYNPTNGSFLATRTYYRAGEFFECRDTPTTAMKLRSPLYAAYTTGAVGVYKVSPVRVNLNGWIIESAGSPLNLLHVTYGKDVVIDNAKMKHVYDACIVLDRCFNSTVTNSTLGNRGAGNPGDYGVVIANCQHWRVADCDIYTRRHPVTTGGYDLVGAVPVRDGIVVNCTLRNDPASGATSGDFHGNTEACKVVNCTLYNGVSLGGKDNGYYNCTVIGSVSNGASVIASEVVGGYMSLIDCHIETFIDPSVFSRGVVDLGGGNAALNGDVVENVTFRILNNTIRSSVLTSATDLIYVGNNGTNKKVNMDVRGNIIEVNNFASLVRMYVAGGGVAASDFIIVDDNVCALSGKYSLFGDGSYSALSVLRLQATSWAETVTVSTGASTKLGTSKAYKWKFPRNPVLILGRVGLSYLGNRIGIPYSATYDSVAATPGIGTDDNTNFSSASAITLTATASIREV